MADIESDIEDMLEAPYKNNQPPQQEATIYIWLYVETNNKEESKLSERNKSEEKDKSERKKSRKDRSRSRSRSRHRKRSRSRSRSRSKRSKRSRSKDRDRRRRSRSRSKRRSRSRSRRRSRSRSDRRRRSRERRRSKTKSPVIREKSPELTPEERDQRTVFCMQLAARIRPHDLEKFFLTVGRIRDVRLITDPRTKRSKGIAYIEFRDIESVPLAIALTGQRLLGVPIIVKLTQAEKNRLPFTGPHIPANLPQTGPIKLYVGSLHPNITEEMLQAIFEPFGLIDAILLARDDFGRSKGYGFVQFANADDGKKAIEQLNNFELAQRPIKVSLYVESTDKSLYPGMVNPIITNLDNDELDRTGVNLGPSGKLALMAKLAEGTGLQVPQQTLDALNMTSTATPNAAAPGAPVATQCFLLSNMFDLEEEMKRADGWVDEIRDDVIAECDKYGGIVHIHVDTLSPEGNIYIKCPTIAVATSAMASLNGRFFAGKIIKASYIPITAYHMRFPEAVSCTKLLEAS
ncbi:unnamed protein product [Brachionus calyciflorus]|uniref:RRM domain-containing protein n=1 Tax=Brachionus calyciflorus TaxID=104777 RepID=A0A814KW31_9BILA|nr:unnamed protein product [Brachionus calyciflorus]